MNDDKLKIQNKASVRVGGRALNRGGREAIEARAVVPGAGGGVTIARLRRSVGHGRSLPAASVPRA